MLGQPGLAGVEVWQPGAKGSVVKALPEGAVELDEHPVVVAAKDKGAWIAQGTALLRWDGEALTKAATPPGAGNILSAALGPDGALYLGTDGGVFRSASGGWEKLALPVAGRSPSLAAADGQLYVAVERSLMRLGAKPGDAPVFTPGAAPAPAGVAASVVASNVHAASVTGTPVRGGVGVIVGVDVAVVLFIFERC